ARAHRDRQVGAGQDHDPLVGDVPGGGADRPLPGERVPDAAVVRLVDVVVADDAVVEHHGGAGYRVLAVEVVTAQHRVRRERGQVGRVDGIDPDRERVAGLPRGRQVEA